jgi:hypothetical protein
LLLHARRGLGRNLTSDGQIEMKVPQKLTKSD